MLNNAIRSRLSAIILSKIKLIDGGWDFETARNDV